MKCIFSIQGCNCEHILWAVSRNQHKGGQIHLSVKHTANASKKKSKHVTCTSASIATTPKLCEWFYHIITNGSGVGTVVAIVALTATLLASKILLITGYELLIAQAAASLLQ